MAENHKESQQFRCDSKMDDNKERFTIKVSDGFKFLTLEVSDTFHLTITEEPHLESLVKGFNFQSNRLTCIGQKMRTF